MVVAQSECWQWLPKIGTTVSAGKTVAKSPVRVLHKCAAPIEGPLPETPPVNLSRTTIALIAPALQKVATKTLDTFVANLGRVSRYPQFASLQLDQARRTAEFFRNLGVGNSAQLADDFACPLEAAAPHGWPPKLKSFLSDKLIR